jgi:recombination protein RecA
VVAEGRRKALVTQHTFEKRNKKEMFVMADDKASADRGKAVEAALLNIEKKFGKGSIMRLGEREVSDIPAISTTSLSLDAAIGVGGVPRGRIVEIYGPESSGKTTLALHIVAEAQKAGGVAAYIDAEHAMDAEYAGKLGVDVDGLLISQPDSGEQALEIAEALVRSNGVDVIVIDSVAALVPRAELDGEMGDSLPGLQARLMSQALRKLTAIVSSSNTCFIFINQIREKIGVMFGSPETTTGGRALKFYSSLRLDIRRIGAIKDGDRAIGNRTKVKVVKNKVAPPFRECEFDIVYGEGISREGDLVDLGVANRVIEKSGAWFSYKGERLGQGRENAKQTLRDNEEMRGRVERDVKVALGISVPSGEEETAADAAAATAPAGRKAAK